MVKDSLEIWEEEWKVLKKKSEHKREVSFLEAAVIGFGGWLRGEEFFLAFLEGMLKFWEETMKIINKSHIMATLKDIFKG